MANPFFSGRIPKDLKNRIDQHRAETGESITDVLVNALSAYVNHPVVRPAADVASPKTEERFKAMEERLAALELSFKRFSLENNVISFDNTKIPDGKPKEILTSALFDNSSDNNIDNSYSEPEEVPKTVDNQFDNKADNKENEIKKVVEPAQPVHTFNDNKFDNSDNTPQKAFQPAVDLPSSATYTSFENLTASDLTNVTGLTQGQIDNYKRKVTVKYQKMGQPLEEKKLLESPEKITTLKPVTVKDYPYDLLYLGQNEKGNNLWSVIPFDNNRYQQLSIEPHISDQVSTDLA